MRERGVKVLDSRWLIDSVPYILLFDIGSTYSILDGWKTDLWNLTGISTPPNDNEAVVLGYLIAWLLGECDEQTRQFIYHPLS